MNYFEYFSEIEERFAARRGSLLLLSPLDWALIETWREAEIPLAAVLRGIDEAFDKYEARKARVKGRLSRINGLAWCAQPVLEAAAAMAEASIGARPEGVAERSTGFEAERVARFLLDNAATLEAAAAEGSLGPALLATASRLRELAAGLAAEKDRTLEDLDRHLTVLEERMQAALQTSLPEARLLAARTAADAELAPYRSRLRVEQLRQVRDQLTQRHLFQELKLPRLSLFYMPLEAEGDAAIGEEAGDR